MLGYILFIHWLLTFIHFQAWLLVNVPEDNPFDRTSNKPKPLLNQKTLGIIQKDIASLVLPSWITRPPHDFGSPSRGKLKADTWRTVCTIALPISLTRLWSTIESKRARLDNFMDLVQGVILATSYTISPKSRHVCLALFMHYQEGLLKLFPKMHRDLPNLHASLHLPQLLDQFGPVHGWWAFPFERLIGRLQAVKTNWKMGTF